MRANSFPATRKSPLQNRDKQGPPTRSAPNLPHGTERGNLGQRRCVTPDGTLRLQKAAAFPPTRRRSAPTERAPYAARIPIPEKRSDKSPGIVLRQPPFVPLAESPLRHSLVPVWERNSG